MATAQLHRLAVWLTLATLVASVQAAGPIHKCVVEGKVTYQNAPCAIEKEKATRPPTVEELNAARKKRLAEAASQAPTVARPAPSSVPGSARLVEPPQSPTPSRAAAFRCDGRTHCSQMRSCSEAKFFLAKCPGVKMDGNRDGTPCEQQWCTHSLAQ